MTARRAIFVASECNLPATGTKVPASPKLHPPVARPAGPPRSGARSAPRPGVPMARTPRADEARRLYPPGPAPGAPSADSAADGRSTRSFGPQM